jgi:hypothetical protein
LKRLRRGAKIGGLVLEAKEEQIAITGVRIGSLWSEVLKEDNLASVMILGELAPCSPGFSHESQGPSCNQ